MTLLSSFAQSPLIQAVGETLLHSLWQAMFVALASALTLSVMKRTAATLRYAVAIFALVLCATLPVVTLLIVLPSSAPAQSKVTSQLTTERASLGPDATLAQQQVQLIPPEEKISTSGGRQTTWAQRRTHSLVLKRGIAAGLPWAVALWLVGVLIHAVQLILAFRITYRLRTVSVKPVPPYVDATVRNLAERLRMNPNIPVRFSKVIDVPLVVGYLRPLILLPASALSGLSLAQLEMLLAHELAHLRRFDHIANLLQSVVETILFFNPAVWWLSRLVRQERECCCDLLAVRVCGGDVYGYANALATLETTRPTHLATLASNGGSLLERILRLTGQTQNRKPHPSHWLLGALLIVLPMLIATLASAQTQGGTLRIAYTSIQQLDPYKSANGDEINAFTQVFEPLFIIGDDFQPVPHLAESWDTPDDITWVFHLRQGVTFQDGNDVFAEGANRELTAEDVVYSINRFLEVSTAFTLGDIASVTALNPYTVEIKTASPDPFLVSDPNRLARVVIVPHEAVEQLGEEEFARNPIGSGPFELVSFTPDQQLEFRRNEDYWLPVNLDGVEFVFIPDPTVQTIALESGDVDVVTYIFNIDSVSQLSENPDLVLLERGGSYRGLGFNVSTPPFDEFAVRDAISKAIDIDAAVNSVVAPFGIRAYGQVPPWVSFEQDPTLSELWSYDPDAALAELAEAGFTDSNGDGILDRDGQPLSFNLKTIAGSQVRVLTILVTQLKELGIDANILQQDTSVWADDLVQGNDTGLFFDYSFAGTTGLYSLFHSSNIGKTNTHYYTNSEVDRLLDKASSTLDFETRNRLWLEAQRLVMQDRAAIPLYFENGYSVTSDRVHDFIPPWAGLNLVSPVNNVYLDE